MMAPDRYNPYPNMLISPQLNAALNAQVGHEFAASLQYVEIAAFLAGEGWAKLAARFYQQSDEERDHALKLVKYVVEAGGAVAIPAIPAPQARFASVEEAVRLSLSWEQTVTLQFNQLMDLAIAEKDYLAQGFLGWFVREQLEEVSSMEGLLKLVRHAGDKKLVYVETLIGKGATEAE
jgi:ferritin